MSDITKHSLSDLVENIKSKKLSSSEVTKAFVERSEKSKELNAYITEDYANALNKAKKFDEKPNLDLKLFNYLWYYKIIFFFIRRIFY